MTPGILLAPTDGVANRYRAQLSRRVCMQTGAGVHLKEAAVIEEAADVADNGRPHGEDIPHKGVHYCVQIPLAIPSFLHPSTSCHQLRCSYNAGICPLQCTVHTHSAQLCSSQICFLKWTDSAVRCSQTGPEEGKETGGERRKSTREDDLVIKASEGQHVEAGGEDLEGGGEDGQLSLLGSAGVA